MQKYEIVIIEWTDAAIHGSGSFSRKEAEDCKLIEGLAVGFLIKETKEFITIAMDMFPNEETLRTVQTYPKSGIKKIIRK